MGVIALTWKRVLTVGVSVAMLGVMSLPSVASADAIRPMTIRATDRGQVLFSVEGLELHHVPYLQVWYVMHAGLSYGVSSDWNGTTLTLTYQGTTISYQPDGIVHSIPAGEGQTTFVSLDKVEEEFELLGIPTSVIERGHMATWRLGVDSVHHEKQ